MNALWSPSNRLRAVVVVALVSLPVMATHAANLTWVGAINNDWNTTDANWAGSAVWSNSTPDNAVFNNINGTITLTQDIFGGSLSFGAGGAPSGAHYTTLTGSNLSLGSVSVWGGYNPSAGGGGVDSIGQAYDQRLTFENMAVNVSGDAAVGRGMLYLNGGTMNVGGRILSDNAWQVFRADNSTVTATGGIDFSSIASQVELSGGTVTTPSIKVGNATWAGDTGLFLGGVTLVPTGDNPDYIAVFNDGDVNSRAAARLTGGGVTIDTAHAVTIATQLVNGSSAGSLTKSGAGTLTLSAGNTYTGDTTVSAGTLAVASTGGLYGASYNNTAVVTVGTGATLQLSAWQYGATGGLGQLDYSPTRLVVNGGTIELTGTGTDTGGGSNFTVGTGGATLRASGSGPQVWTIAADNRFDYATITNNTGLTLDGLGTGEIGKPIAGSGPLTKNGSGTWSLSGTNTFTGNTTVSAGTLVVASSGKLYGGGVTDAPTITVNAGGTLQLNGWSWDAAGSIANLTYSADRLVVNGGTIEYTGSSNFNPGDPGSSSRNLTIGTSGATLKASSPSGQTWTLSSGNGNLVNNTGLFLDGEGAGDVQNVIEGSGTVTKTGGGTWTLSGTNTYTGNTTVTSGTLIIGGSLAAGSQLSVASGATLQTNVNNAWGDQSQNIGSWTIAGTLLTNSDGAGTTMPSSVTLNGGTLANNGLDYGAFGNFLGSTTITANGTGNTISARVGMASTLTLDTPFAGDALTVSGVLGATVVNSSGMTKSGSGTVTLTGSNTYTGATSVSAGTLLVNGSLAADSAVSVASGATLGGSGTIGGPVSILAGGILAPGTSPGTLTVNNTLALDGASILDFEIDALDRSSSVFNDLITGVTDLTLGGTLNLSGTGDFSTVTQGTTWRLFDYSGTLTDNTLAIGTAPTLAAGLSFVVDTSTANQVNIGVVPEPGSTALAALGLAAACWVAARRRRERSSSH